MPTIFDSYAKQIHETWAESFKAIPAVDGLTVTLDGEVVATIDIDFKIHMAADNDFETREALWDMIHPPTTADVIASHTTPAIESFIDGLFKQAHFLAGTKHGDLTDEQYDRLEGMKKRIGKELTDLVIEQVNYNLSNPFHINK